MVLRMKEAGKTNRQEAVRTSVILCILHPQAPTPGGKLEKSLMGAEEIRKLGSQAKVSQPLTSGQPLRVKPGGEESRFSVLELTPRKLSLCKTVEVRKSRNSN